jgi:HSP20 family protein
MTQLQPTTQHDIHVEPWQRPLPTDELWDDLYRLRDSLRQLLGGLGWPDSVRLAADGMVPLADVEETDEAYVVEVELPGVRRGDVTVSVEGRRLSVDAERRERQRSGVLRRRARTVGHLHYEVVVPGDVDADETTASLNDGVLTVRLHKSMAQRARRIPVA